MSAVFKHILERLPYDEPFRFVDGLVALTQQEVEGFYTFREDSWFYKGHFKGRPVTPGVILTECCAQIGLVCLGMGQEGTEESRAVALAETEMNFLQEVLPGEKVRVQAEKVYYRFGKLRAKVRLYKEDGTLACKGVLSGMVIVPKA
jgi:3-hydroxyacyl-[acyl-carrier-protein] dehydratase